MRALLVSLVVGMAGFVAIPGLLAQRGAVSGAAPADAAPSGRGAGDSDPAVVRAANARFAGVWKLVAEETRDPKGQIVAGPNAASGGRFGYITYDPAGYMGVTIAWNKRPAFAGKASTPDQA